ncbi:hypothetical protein MRB53_036973 [Persea americana]|nr:hypothetical protein MRB53_036973 [Persea americana]
MPQKAQRSIQAFTQVTKPVTRDAAISTRNHLWPASRRRTAPSGLASGRQTSKLAMLRSRLRLMANARSLDPERLINPRTPSKPRDPIHGLLTPETTPNKSNDGCNCIYRPDHAHETAQNTTTDSRDTSCITTFLAPSMLTTQRQTIASIASRLHIHALRLSEGFGAPLRAHVSTTPCDVRTLCQTMAKIWRRRAVTLVDIRRLIGVLNYRRSGEAQATAGPGCGLVLTDFGRGRICVERINADRDEEGMVSRTFDDVALKEMFDASLSDWWTSQSIHLDDDAEILSQLPLTPITPCSSLSKTAALHATGQRRLDDLKNFKPTASTSIPNTNSTTTPGPALAPRSPNTKSPSSSAAATSTSTSIPRPLPRKPTSRTSALLSRLQSKEAARALLPSLTPADLARRAAQDRAPEVLALLRMLCAEGVSNDGHGCAGAGAVAGSGGGAGRKRMSLSMEAVVERIRQSARVPISREEAERCVRVLAEVTYPQGEGVEGKERSEEKRFVRVVVRGGVVAVLLVVVVLWSDGCLNKRYWI